MSCVTRAYYLTLAKNGLYSSKFKNVDYDN